MLNNVVNHIRDHSKYVPTVIANTINGMQIPKTIHNTLCPPLSSVLVSMVFAISETNVYEHVNYYDMNIKKLQHASIIITKNYFISKEKGKNDTQLKIFLLNAFMCTVS